MGQREIGVDLSVSSKKPYLSVQSRVRTAASILPHSETEWRRMIAKHIFGRWAHHLRNVFFSEKQRIRSSIDVGHKAGVGKLPGRHDRAWLRICPGHLAAILNE
jgi:hypothetical protein